MINQVKKLILYINTPFKGIPISGFLLLLLTGFFIGFILPNYDISELRIHALASIFIYFGLCVGFLGGILISHNRDSKPDYINSSEQSLFLYQDTLLLHHFIPFICTITGAAITFSLYLLFFADWNYPDSFFKTNELFNYLSAASATLITLIGLLHRSVVSDIQIKLQRESDNIKNFTDCAELVRASIKNSLNFEPTLSESYFISERIYKNPRDGDYLVNPKIANKLKFIEAKKKAAEESRNWKKAAEKYFADKDKSPMDILELSSVFNHHVSTSITPDSETLDLHQLRRILEVADELKDLINQVLPSGVELDHYPREYEIGCIYREIRSRLKTIDILLTSPLIPKIERETSNNLISNLKSRSITVFCKDPSSDSYYPVLLGKYISFLIARSEHFEIKPDGVQLLKSNHLWQEKFEKFEGRDA